MKRPINNTGMNPKDSINLFYIFELPVEIKEALKGGWVKE